MLRKYEVTPSKFRLGDRAGVRGYERAALADTWDRYLPALLPPR